MIQQKGAEEKSNSPAQGKQKLCLCVCVCVRKADKVASERDRDREFRRARQPGTGCRGEKYSTSEEIIARVGKNKCQEEMLRHQRGRR